MKYLHWILLIAIFFISCNNRTTNYEGLISKKMDIKEFMDSYVQIIDFVPLETSNESLIGEIIKVANFENKYLILHKVGDNEVLSLYDLSGKFLGNIGSMGRANNEYLNINDFTISYETREIYIFDSSPKVVVYNYDGSYHSTIEIKEPTLQKLFPFICDSKIMEDGRIVLGFAPNSRSEIEFCITTLCFDQIDVLSQASLKMQYGAFVSSRNTIISECDNIYAIRPLSTTITTYSNGGHKDICLNSQIQEEITALSHNCKYIDDFYPKVLAKSYISSLFPMGKYCLATSSMDMYLFNNSAIVSVDCRNNQGVDFPIMPGSIVWSDKNQIITTVSPQFIMTALEFMENHSRLKGQIANISNGLSEDSNPVLVRYNININL